MLTSPIIQSLTLTLAASLAALATVGAQPVHTLEPRIYRGLYCAPASQWSNGR